MRALDSINVYLTITCRIDHFRPCRRDIAESAIIRASMPSPIGHALAGLAVALVSGRPPAARFREALTNPFTLACIGLAVLPDADLLIPGFHRTATHSVTATLLVIIVAGAV